MEKEEKLKKKLKKLGIPVVAGKVKKSDIKKALSAHTIKKGPFSFDVDGVDIDPPTPNLSGTFKYKNKESKGFFEYSDESGIGWDLKPKIDSDKFEDEHSDDWTEFHSELVNFLVKEGANFD